MTKYEALQALRSAVTVLNQAKQATRDNPGDTEALRRLSRAAAFAERSRRRYFDVSVAGIAAQISAMVPGEALIAPDEPQE